MRITPIPSHAIVAAWPELQALLAPAIAHDASLSTADVRLRLIHGQMEAAYVSVAHGEGVVVTEMCMTGGDRACWLNYVAGKLGSCPKAALQTFRAVMAHYEILARRQNCTAIYVGGRDWSRIFPDFALSPTSHDPNRLRKAL